MVAIIIITVDIITDITIITNIIMNGKKNKYRFMCVVCDRNIVAPLHPYAVSAKPRKRYQIYGLGFRV